MTYRKRNEHKYTRALFNTGDEQICSYCGDPASTKDHVLPLVWADTQLEGQHIIVPACVECNAMAGGKKFVDIYEKLCWLHKRIRTKYANILSTPDWDERELEEMEIVLRGYVENSLNLKARIHERLAWGKDVIKKVERSLANVNKRR